MVSLGRLNPARGGSSFLCLKHAIRSLDVMARTTGSQLLECALLPRTPGPAPDWDLAKGVGGSLGMTNMKFPASMVVRGPKGGFQFI